MRPGSRLGGYEIVEPIGKGGMGVVYRARDATLDRDVAVKMLPAEMATDGELLARLKREARSLAALNHPGIATVHGFEEAEGSSFIVMELVEGPTLADRLRGGALPVAEALSLAVQIASALEAAHERGIVHRDLKPENLKVTLDGRVKVLDFGLAKRFQSGTPNPAEQSVTTEALAVTGAGSVVGTPPYMSPEQVRGQEVDERTDVWAFGCVLFEMLTGTSAFARDTPAHTLAAVVADPPREELLPGELPPGVRQLLHRMLAKSPDDRLRDLAAARVELDRALEAVRSGAGSAWRRVPGRTLGVLLAAAGLIAAVIAGWQLLEPGGTGEAADRSIAVLPFETLGSEESTSFADGVHGDMLTRLSKLTELSVTSRTSVMQYREPDRPLPEIAGELGVTWVLLGEVQEVGSQVQVNARLVNAREDRQVWADSYRRELTAENLFDIQSELTEEIARQLEARLTPEERRLAGWAPTEDLAAYRLYVKGRGHLEQWTERDMRLAVDYFQQAIERDPDYALAWSGLADALSLLRWYGFALPEDAPRPEEAARRALGLDPDLAEAHASRAIVLSSAGRQDGPEALRELRRAVSLRPSYAHAFIWIAWVHLLIGEPGAAVEPAERAAELDPLAPAARVFLAETYLANNRAEAALREAVRGREIQPGHPLTHFMEGLALHHLGRHDEAGAAIERTLGLVPPDGRSPTRSQIRAVLGVIRAVAGDASAARAQLELIDAAEDPFSAGLVRAALGDAVAAMELFAQVREWGQFSTEHLRYFFPEVLGPLRGSERYEELLRSADRSWGVSPA